MDQDRGLLFLVQCTLLSEALDDPVKQRKASRWERKNLVGCHQFDVILQKPQGSKRQELELTDEIGGNIEFSSKK